MTDLKKIGSFGTGSTLMGATVVEFYRDGAGRLHVAEFSNGAGFRPICVSDVAAKDARIAELESENSHLRHGMTGDYDLDAWLEWCAQKDATPSEDVGEVGQLLVTALRQYQHNDCSGLLAGYDCAEAERIVSDLIAQHSRIMAAKDAEIAKFKEANRELAESNVRRRDKIVELMRKLDAQPARQVGRDEREQFEAHFGTMFFSSCFERENGGEYAGRGLQGAWLGWQARAALAPAAACVMPEHKSETAPPPFERGYNAALDEVARLNHNPIPVELIKQAAHFLEANASANSIEQAIADELRALLGKDGGA